MGIQPLILHYQELRVTEYPRLEMIRQETLRLEAHRQERTFIPGDEWDDESDDDVFIELRKPETEAACMELIDSLKYLSQAVRVVSEQPKPEEVLTKSKIRVSLALYLGNLFSAISKAFRCPCVPDHQAALLLFSNRTLPTIGSPVTFTMFLSRRGRTKRWKEAAVTITEHEDVTNIKPRQRVRINLPPTAAKIGSSTPVIDLCSIIEKSKNRLNLSISGPSLSTRAETKYQLLESDYCETISFTEGFLENEIPINFESKLCLALVLSYAFIDFCDGPWFVEGWTKTNLYFMQRGDRVLLQPFLMSNMAGSRTKQGHHSTSMRSTWAKRLLQHGILLMEIFQQDSFQNFIGEDGNVRNSKDLAYFWFRSIDWDVCERLVQIVETCIRGELFDSGSRPNDDSDETIIQMFCEKILAPLEADFALFYQKEDPDQVISRLSLPRAGPKRPLVSIATPAKLKVNVLMNTS